MNSFQWDRQSTATNIKANWILSEIQNGLMASNLSEAQASEVVISNIIRFLSSTGRPVSEPNEFYWGAVLTDKSLNEFFKSVTVDNHTLSLEQRGLANAAIGAYETSLAENASLEDLILKAEAKLNDYRSYSSQRSDVDAYFTETFSTLDKINTQATNARINTVDSVAHLPITNNESAIEGNATISVLWDNTTEGVRLGNWFEIDQSIPSGVPQSEFTTSVFGIAADNEAAIRGDIAALLDNDELTTMEFDFPVLHRDWPLNIRSIILNNEFMDTSSNIGMLFSTDYLSDLSGSSGDGFTNYDIKSAGTDVIYQTVKLNPNTYAYEYDSEITPVMSVDPDAHSHPTVYWDGSHVQSGLQNIWALMYPDRWLVQIKRQSDGLMKTEFGVHAHWPIQRNSTIAKGFAGYNSEITEYLQSINTESSGPRSSAAAGVDENKLTSEGIITGSYTQTSADWTEHGVGITVTIQIDLKEAKRINWVTVRGGVPINPNAASAFTKVVDVAVRDKEAKAGQQVRSVMDQTTILSSELNELVSFSKYDPNSIQQGLDPDSSGFKGSMILFFEPVTTDQIIIILTQDNVFPTHFGHPYDAVEIERTDTDYIYKYAAKTRKDTWIQRLKSTTSAIDMSQFSEHREVVTIWNAFGALVGGLIGGAKGILEGFMNSGTKIDVEAKKHYQGYDVFKGYRYSVALKDVNIYSSQYAETAEIISTKYGVSQPISSISLYADEGIPSINKDFDWLQYYVSIDNGSTWTQIMPISRPNINSNDIPTVLNVGKEIGKQGESYYNLMYKVVLKRPANDSGYTPVVRQLQFTITSKRV